jgi:hypothetical protein
MGTRSEEPQKLQKLGLRIVDCREKRAAQKDRGKKKK